MTKKHVIIIGAGIGGIATANLLGKAGYKVDVYEKNKRPGGRADIMKAHGFTFDMGPSWYLMPEVFEHFFDLMDEEISAYLDLRRLTPAYKVFFETGAPAITITSNPDQDVRTFEAIESGAGRKLSTYVKKGDEIYQLALRHFLYSNFSSLTDFFQSDILIRTGTMLTLAFLPIDRYIKRFVRDIRLQQILEYPMVFLGTSPFKAPAIYSLMSALDFKQGVYYPMGGMYKIIESLISISQKYDITYHYDSPVRHINGDGTIASGITLSSGMQHTADIIISNADLHFTETQLLAPRDQSYPEAYWKNKQAGPSALLLYLGIKGTLANLEHHNLIFVEDWKENFRSIYETKTFPAAASIYICKPSGIDPSVAPEGHENVFVLVPLPPGRVITAAKQAELVERYLNQLSVMTQTPNLQKRIVFKHVFGPDDFVTKFHSWRATALGPSHILRQSAFFRTPNISKKLSNVYYVGGGTTPGIGLPMCLIGAELIYKRLAGDTKGGAVTNIKPIGEK